MERSGAPKWLLLALAALLLVIFVPRWLGGTTEHLQPLRPELTEHPAVHHPERVCDIWGPGFHAQIGSYGASVQHFYLLDPQFRHDGRPMDLYY